VNHIVCTKRIPRFLSRYLSRSQRKIKAADELALTLVPFSFQAAEHAADPGRT